MKTLIISSFPIISSFFTFLTYAQDIELKGNTFTVIKEKKDSTEQKTPYNYKDSKGNIYPIYLNNRGKLI